MKNDTSTNKVIGLTGGIGSGKSLICELFSSIGYPTYNSDSEAKMLYQLPEIKEKVIKLLGNEAFNGNTLNKEYVGKKVFSDSELLNQLNGIIHPAVRSHFEDWKASQKSAYVIKEAAILIESGAYKTCDFIITVSAPENLRINRVVSRDQVTPEEVKARISKQLSDQERETYASWVILNDGTTSVIKQVMEIHEKLSELPR